MKNNILQDRPALRRMIRFGEIVVVGGLLAYAAFMWRELKILRAAPVALPASWFIVTADVDQVQRIEAGGSWVAKDGKSSGLQTSIIDCTRAKMQCMESSAQVAVNEGGMLENVQTLFEIESWTDNEVRTKAANKPCGTRRLTLDIGGKEAVSVAVAANPPSTACKSPFTGEQTYRLVTGEQAQADAIRKAKPF